MDRTLPAFICALYEYNDELGELMLYVEKTSHVIVHTQDIKGSGICR